MRERKHKHKIKRTGLEKIYYDLFVKEPNKTRKCQLWVWRRAGELTRYAAGKNPTVKKLTAILPQAMTRAELELENHLDFIRYLKEKGSHL